MDTPIEEHFEYYMEEFDLSFNSLGYKWIRFSELRNPPDDRVYCRPSPSVLRKMQAEGQGNIRRINP